jgi:hypothetical protein
MINQSEPLLGKLVLIDLPLHQGVWEVVEENCSPSVKVERRGDCLTKWVDRHFIEVLKDNA